MSHTPQRPVRHIVLLAFKAGTSAEAIANLTDAFLALRNEIPQIRDLEWGEDISPEGRQGGHTHALMITFESEPDRDAYLPAAARQRFIADVLRPHVDKATVIDYVARLC